MENTNFTFEIIELIKTIDQEETKNIVAAAKLIYRSLNKEGLLHVFCTGHSHMMAEEMFYRAGGLAQVNPILVPFLMQHEGAVSSTKYERLPGIARIIFEGLDVRPGEPFMIVSNSGINAVPVEMALCAKENGNPVIAVTSKQVSMNLKPRGDHNCRLYEVADVVIDNHAPYGDGIFDSPEGKVGGVSSIIGVYIAQRLVLEIVENYKNDGLVPAIYNSANIEGGDEHNEVLMKRYKKRIRSLY
ncbi:MAG: SIS domain-containing protein [Bacilli bacterium]|nr:SIS domain-containing protein [Bacilli bacterium]